MTSSFLVAAYGIVTVALTGFLIWSLRRLSRAQKLYGVKNESK